MRQTFWALALMLVGFGATGAQLDRQARTSGTLASSVPEPFRAFAQERVAVHALATDDPVRALKEARRLVAKRPIPAEHLRTLAVAQSLNGMQGDSLATIQAASQRGWRDPIVQETMLRLAIENDRYDEAARRYAALIAVPATSDNLLQELGPLALKTDEARVTFAAILAPSERWHRTFLRRAPGSLPNQTFVEVVLQAKSLGAMFDCGQLQQALQSSDHTKLLSQKGCQKRHRTEGVSH